MSDISGPPLPKPVEPVARTTGKTSSVSRDPQQAQTQAREHKGDQSAKNEQAEQLRGREPAVSISATAAHLEVGERLKEQVSKIDNEGRPIIVTETATFALRPDAGLRPGDDVKLEIVEAGHKVSADLHERNGLIIDPPVRLSLIVIAIHVPQQPSTPASDQQVPNTAPLPTKTGYGPTAQTKSSSLAPTDTLVNVLGRTPQSSNSASLNANQSISSVSTEDNATASTQKSGSNPGQTGNPDFLASRNSSPDLATLIAAQQGNNKGAGYMRAGGQEIGLPKAFDPSHFIPRSSLTEISTPGPQDGLGPSIKAFSASGQALSLQVMDARISQVSPAQVATVLSVRPLPPDEAKTLPLAISAFGPSAGTLATIETSKGNFIIPLAQAQNLSGEQIKVSVAEESQVTAQQTKQATFNAILASPGSGQRRPVRITVSQNTSPTGAPGEAQVKAVHTVRAFLTPKGPSADFRIETTRGDLFLTMPNGMRPTTEDLITILPGQATQLQHGPLPTPLVDVASQLAAGSALSTLGAHQWPTLEQSFATVLGADPALAGQLASKGAQGGGKLVNSLLFFLSAAGRGSPEAWLGQEASRALEQANKSLFDAMKSELSRLMLAATDTTREWRPMLIPLELRFPDMPLVAFLFGPPPREEGTGSGKDNMSGEDDENGDAQRFVVEVQFSILGAIQLDGLVRENRFDLAMRSEKPLPAALRHEASDLFNSALAANGYNGQLTITEAQPFPVEIEALLQSA
ncbi:hypothetical protein [Kordiimonas lacus]|uniref:Hook-length control protein FliK n=1 Tax=Kordiimonas lacus TaxID=637679 RepID=A0A1G6YV16_9PROT|nr:hypothetical protein [Kordiimonas lacus]SDD94180.1 hypothetical protein SAMN04488071_1754 [Kordiimonas lacus]